MWFTFSKREGLDPAFFSLGLRRGRRQTVQKNWQLRLQSRHTILSSCQVQLFWRAPWFGWRWRKNSRDKWWFRQRLLWNLDRSRRILLFYRLPWRRLSYFCRWNFIFPWRVLLWQIKWGLLLLEYIHLQRLHKGRA